MQLKNTNLLCAPDEDEDDDFYDPDWFDGQ
jgi:hypothetical protein